MTFLAALPSLISAGSAAGGLISNIFGAKKARKKQQEALDRRRNYAMLGLRDTDIQIDREAANQRGRNTQQAIDSGWGGSTVLNTMNTGTTEAASMAKAEARKNFYNALGSIEGDYQYRGGNPEMSAKAGETIGTALSQIGQLFRARDNPNADAAMQTLEQTAAKARMAFAPTLGPIGAMSAGGAGVVSGFANAAMQAKKMKKKPQQSPYSAM